MTRRQHWAKLAKDFNINLYHLIRWFVKDYTNIILRAKKISMKQTFKYLTFLIKNIVLLTKPAYYIKMLSFLLIRGSWTVFNLLKIKIWGYEMSKK